MNINKHYIGAYIIMCICVITTIEKIEISESMTSIVYTRQGPIQGRIVKASGRRQCCGDVEVYLGIPYSAQPERFMPPRNPPNWEEILIADTMKPVCPQFLPDLSDNKIPTDRKKFIEKMIPFLKNESEDCLHLNIYVPRPHKGEKKFYPVIMLIHGESFEWNSGNLYDGSVIAGFGQVIFITINFRLGIFGFLKPDLSVKPSNYGLLDQIAALHWIGKNIGYFGGDSKRITILGHDTGAICAHLLMLSPLANGLFHRVILMSGSALSSSALTSELLYMQVAHELNCPSDDMKNCLQKRTQEDIKKAAKSVYTVPFKNAFTPVVDDIVVLSSATDQMTTYKELFKRYDLMGGVTEVESYYMLEGDYWVYGLNTNEAKKILESYTKSRYERFPNNALIRTIDRYYGYLKSPTVINIRNAVLDALSDALVMAPLIQTMKYHSVTERSNYFYVFGHHNISDHLRMQKSVAGDELPYILGVPLAGPSYHYDGIYNGMERCLSMDMMRYWTNFAKTGNPNGPSLTQWPSYTAGKQAFILLDVKPGNGFECGRSSEIWYEYRKPYDKFWNVILPNATGNCSDYLQCFNIGTGSMDIPDINVEDMADHSKPTYNLPYDDRYLNFENIKPTQIPERTDIPIKIPDQETDVNFISTSSILIILGFIILAINICIYFLIYRRKGNRRLPLDSCVLQPRVTTGGGNENPNNNHGNNYSDGCYSKHFQTDSTLPYGSKKIICQKSAFQQPEENNFDSSKLASIKPEAITGKRIKRWPLSRQCSASTVTMDPHTKVKEWISHEIVHKCSPKFFRKDKTKNTKFNNNDSNLENISSNNMYVVKPNDLPKQQKINYIKKRDKVSVGIDATPAARTGSVLKQVPIELTKSLDEGKNSIGFGQSKIISSSMSSIINKPLKNFVEKNSESDDFSISSKGNTLHKSSATIRLKTPAIIREQLAISHTHSRSDPSPFPNNNNNNNFLLEQPIYSQVNKKMKTFSNESSIMTNPCSVDSSSHYEDINVTCCDEKSFQNQSATVCNIKKRFPKVLPDFPSIESADPDISRRNLSKRLSLPAEIYPPFEENCNKIYSKTLRRPPVPPPRFTPLLGKQSSDVIDYKNLPLVNEEEQQTEQAEFEKLENIVSVKTAKLEPRIIIKPQILNNRKPVNNNYSQIPRVVHPNHNLLLQNRSNDKRSVTTSTTGIPKLISTTAGKIPNQNVPEFAKNNRN